jgi:2-polyprenyl-6-methoxyphenol hydroxylase-like FAD-dependent oxidoreductase
MLGARQTDVLIVGAGPTGLLTAALLARRGVRVRILDQHWSAGAHSYGLALHPRSLELLEPLSVVPSLLEQGRRIDRVGLWDGDRRRAEISLVRPETRYPFVLVLAQSVLEGELEDRLLAHGVPVLWNHRLERLCEEAEQVTAEVVPLEVPAAERVIERARFVVGADGYHSAVREHLGCRFEEHGPLATFSIFEVEGDTDPGSELVVAFRGPLASAMWPMPGTRRRFGFEIEHAGQHEASLARLNELIRERMPFLEEARGELAWSAVAQFDRRLAASMGRGRTWLVGDAVHVTTPLGVQSLNAGLVDAHELAARLGGIARGASGVEALGTYEAERRAELECLFGAGSPAAPRAAAEWTRERFADIIPALPATGRYLDALIEQLG